MKPNTQMMFLIFRAKTIKNVVVINEELTAEEWKRRFEKEKDKVAKLRGALGRYEQELQRWRGGKLRVHTHLENPWISGVQFQGHESTWNWFSVLESLWFFLLNIKRLQGSEKTAKISDFLSSSASTSMAQQTGNHWFEVNFMKKSRDPYSRSSGPPRRLKNRMDDQTILH